MSACDVFQALRAMFVDPVRQQAMDIDIDTQFDEFEWLLISIPDIKIFGMVERLIQDSLHQVRLRSLLLLG